MTLWILPLLPVVAGAAIWASAPRGAMPAGGRVERASRRAAGATGTAVLAATLGLAVWAAVTHPATTFGWGDLLTLHAEVTPVGGVMAVLVPAVAIPVVVYAAAHEPLRGLHRLVGLLVAFVGAMELLVVAADLLALLVAWELVGWASWALIGHDWREADKPAAAAHAFNATRFGDLGLFIAAGAAYAATGSLRFTDLLAVNGRLEHLLVAGIVLAAVSKSAQVPFSPWLFSAMGGPTPVSALLHAATMVAAGAYLLVRLSTVLEATAWFGPVVITIGLATALAGGIVASIQDHAKKVLAASTSAHYGLMFVAIGAGYASAGLAHLVTHAAFKALLFLTAGVAITAVGSGRVGRMRLGSRLPHVAWLTGIGTLALAAVPPLGGAWTKEKVVAAAGHSGAWLALLVIAAGALSAFYAVRYQVLAFGRAWHDIRDVHEPGRPVVVSLALLAAACVALGVLWLPGAEHTATRLLGGEFATGKAWEVVASLALVAVGAYAAFGVDRQDRLATLGVSRPARAPVQDWFAIPAATRALVVDPFRSLCAGLARFDDHVVDRGVRVATAVAEAASRTLSTGDVRVVDAVVRSASRLAAGIADATAAVTDPIVDGTVEHLAGGIGFAGRDSRRLQTGLAHHYYVIVTLGLGLLAVAAAVWR